jgi:hypothetical protein
LPEINESGDTEHITVCSLLSVGDNSYQVEEHNADITGTMQSIIKEALPTVMEYVNLFCKWY